MNCLLFSMAQRQKRKQWSSESMAEACKSVEDGKGLREASRQYCVPVETLRRRVNGTVELECKPGPATVFSKEVEDKICAYLISMADMGYGLSREMVMGTAYTIAEKTHRKHPFTGDSAGRSWLDGFRRRHPNLTIRTPQPLSYCRALCANEDIIGDFFGKLGGVYGKLNLISKPMQIYNADETGISIVHKPGKVIAQLGRRNVYSITSAERGKTHTIMACVSASGYVLPPMMIYPRKRAVPDNCKIGAVPNTLFRSSESGWMNSDLFLEWFKFFIENIPPTRPVLLITDGHASHVSIEVIELCRANGIHLLCLPAHNTHILQALDVGVLKSFKSYFSKAGTVYVVNNPGRVITADILASLVGEAWPQSFTALNIMSGFRKCGVFPFNPSAVKDRQIAPSKAFKSTNPSPTEECRDPEPGSPLFTSEQESLYKERFEEGYDLRDPSFMAWLKLNHPEAPVSVHGSDVPSVSTDPSHTSAVQSDSTRTCSSDVLDEVLALPKPKPTKKRRKAVNSRTVCLTDPEVLEDMKRKEEKKAEEKEMVATKKLERDKKKQEKKRAVEEKKIEREERKKQKEREKEKKKEEKRKKEKGKGDGLMAKLSLDDSSLDSECDANSTNSDDVVCPKCGMAYVDDEGLWVCCDGCDRWFNLQCTNITSKVPNKYFCEDC